MSHVLRGCATVATYYRLCLYNPTLLCSPWWVSLPTSGRVNAGLQHFYRSQLKASSYFTGRFIIQAVNGATYFDNNILSDKPFTSHRIRKGLRTGSKSGHVINTNAEFDRWIGFCHQIYIIVLFLLNSRYKVQSLLPPARRHAPVPVKCRLWSRVFVK